MHWPTIVLKIYVSGGVFAFCPISEDLCHRGAIDFCWSFWVFRKLCPVITMLTLNSFSFRIAQSALFRIISVSFVIDWILFVLSFIIIYFFFLFLFNTITHRRILLDSRILFFIFLKFLVQSLFEIPLTNRSGQQWMFDWGFQFPDQFPDYDCACTSTAPRPPKRAPKREGK